MQDIRIQKKLGKFSLNVFRKYAYITLSIHEGLNKIGKKIHQFVKLSGFFFVKTSSGHETLEDFHENLHFCYCVPYWQSMGNGKLYKDSRRMKGRGEIRWKSQSLFL